MREKHIVNLLEERPLGSLSVAELDIVKAHIATCSECLRAYEAAQASLLLLQERASAIVEPPLFFQTKVLAAIREQNLTPKRLGLLSRWRTARPLVAAMGALVVVLLALTFFTDSSQLPIEPSDLVSMNDDSAAWVVVDPGDAEDEMTYSQALTVLYDPPLEAGDNDGK
jgi:anti-sigma factor RsiW